MKNLAYLLTITLMAMTAFAGDFLRVEDSVPGVYIVKLKASSSIAEANRTIDELSAAYGRTPRHRYQGPFSGFSIEIPEAAAIALSKNPRVEYVEEVAPVRVPTLGVSTNYQYTGADQGLWHLDRSDERQIDDGGLDGYYAWCSTPTQVRAYVVDTGVRAGHTQFAGGQVEAGFDALPLSGGSPSDPCAPERLVSPGNYGYHGTAVASVLAGIDYGYAKYLKIVPIRVIGCTGQGLTEDVVAGLNWLQTPVCSTCSPTNGTPTCPTCDVTNGQLPAVINMSFFTPHTTSLQNVLASLKQKGYVIFTSANNFPNDDACLRAPARYARGNNGPVISVGGTMIGGDGNGAHNQSSVDYRWQEYADGLPKTGQDGGSSYGTCVDIWAPARNIKVALYTGASHYTVLSGTSFSSPLVAGMVVDGYLRSVYSPNAATPDYAWAWLLNQTTTTGATTHDSTGNILVRDRKTTPHGRMAFQLQGCRRRL